MSQESFDKQVEIVITNAQEMCQIYVRYPGPETLYMFYKKLTNVYSLLNKGAKRKYNLASRYVRAYEYMVEILDES